MDKKHSIASEVFDLLEGTWQGKGRATYPTTHSFDYQETLIFTRKNDSTLAYEQRTEKRPDGTDEFVPSHWENGFVSILENGELEMVNAQSGGRGEVLTGYVEQLEAVIRLHFASKTLLNDARMVSTARVFELDGDQLRYEMQMSTTKVEHLNPHLTCSLERVR